MWTRSCYVMSARCQACKNAFTFDPYLFLFEDTSTGRPATSSSSQARSKILLRDVLRSTVAPADFCWLLLKLFGKSSFSSPESSSVSLSSYSFGGKIINLPLEMKSSLSYQSFSEDTSKFSEYSRASWTFINFLAAILYSFNIQIKEKKQTANL